MAARLTRRAAAAALAAAAANPVAANPVTASPTAVSDAAPRRVVSLNPCLDVILVQVADRAQIAALTHYARDPLNSSVGPIARSLPFTHGSAEEVVVLRPDLVLTARNSPAATRTALERLGVRTAFFDVPETIATSLAQVTQVARAVGRPERGEALAARIRAAIEASAPAPGEPELTALVFQSGGFASAEGTLMDEMMRRAGFANAAARYGLRRTGNVPLELILADPPDVLLAGQPKPGAPSWADRVLTHPALARLKGRVYAAAFPQRLIYCGGPVLIETAAMLAKARRDALALRTGRAPS